MCKLKKMSYFLLSGAFLVLSTSVSAGIYKCTNEKTGKIQYLDKPCSVDLSEKKIKAVKDPKGGFIPAPFKEASKDLSKKGQVQKGKDEIETPQQRQAKIDEKYKDYRSDISDKQKKAMYEEEQAMQERDEDRGKQDILKNPSSVTPDELEVLKRELGLDQDEEKV